MVTEFELKILKHGQPNMHVALGVSFACLVRGRLGSDRGQHGGASVWMCFTMSVITWPDSFG